LPPIVNRTSNRVPAAAGLRARASKTASTTAVCSSTIKPVPGTNDGNHLRFAWLASRPPAAPAGRVAMS